MQVVECISRDFNGYYFCDKFLARELVSQILTYVEYKSIIENCRLVCKQWNAIIADPLFWKHKTELEKKIWPNVPHTQIMPLRFYASIYLYQPLDRNLIQNPNGKEKLAVWTVLSEGGNGFAFEQPPVGADSVPKEADNIKEENSCFATSYHSCSKEQLIDLTALGVLPEVIKNFKPKISCQDWYAGRFDCGCVYECTFSLLDKAKKVIADYTYRQTIQQWQGREWHKVGHCFKDFSDNVRFVKFYHGGTDTQFWNGHYGSKMTGSSVIISFS